MFIVHQIIGVIADPLMILFLGIGLGVGLRSRCRKIGAWVIGWTLALVWVMAMPYTTEKLAKWIERDYYPEQTAEAMPEAEAIILLGGGVWSAQEGSDWPYPDLKEAADRAWHAARLWRARRAPKIYCTCPDASRSTPPFLMDLGVPREAIVCFDGPRNTEEEAKRYEVEFRGGERKVKVLLVTSASHMKRAEMIFMKYAPGLEVIPAATDFMYVEPVKREFNIRRYLPSVGSLASFNVILHELLGLLRYAVK